MFFSHTQPTENINGAMKRRAGHRPQAAPDLIDFISDIYDITATYKEGAIVGVVGKYILAKHVSKAKFSKKPDIWHNMPNPERSTVMKGMTIQNETLRNNRNRKLYKILSEGKKYGFWRYLFKANLHRCL